MPFLDSLDIANRALQLVGQPPILSVGEDSKANRETSNAYDKVRRPELRRNNWRFAIKYAALRAIDRDTRLLAPRLWAATQLYLPGAIVTDANGSLWISGLAENLGNAPGSSAAWDQYFGPMTVHLYAASTGYFAGELVYTLETAGSFVVFVSLEDGNTDEPGTATAYDATVTYGLNDVVSSAGSQWRSLITLNKGTTPADAPAAYNPAVIYAISNTVTGADGFIYSSIGSGNVGNDPTTTTGSWTNTGVAAAWDRTPSLYVSSKKWRPLFANAINMVAFLYPMGTGPAGTPSAMKLYHLPANFLREAPQSPKSGSTSYLGAPTGLAYNDWIYNGDYLQSSSADPIVYRFSADITDVTKMDDMFCEGLACRVALAVCEPLTQSNTKFQQIGAEYKTFMSDARSVNAIEQGPTEPPEDDYIAARL